MTSKNKRGKCENCNKRRVLKKIELIKDVNRFEEDSRDRSNFYYSWMCRECEEETPKYY